MKNRIKELRKEKGVSQEKLATVLDVSRQTVISIERGKYNPSLPLAIEIARYFDTYVEKVFLYDE